MKSQNSTAGGSPAAQADMLRGFQPETPQAMHGMTRSARTIIQARRSRFPAEYTGVRLDDSVIEQILESANWAPTHKLTEPWRFVVFCDAALPRLFEAFVDIYRATTPPERQKQAKIDKFRSMPDKVSHVIAIIMHRDPARRIPEIEEISSVACAVQNMHLALADFPQAGAYWSTGAGTFSPQMAEWLGLQEADRCMGFFYLGTVPQAERHGRRTSIASKTEWVKS